MSERLRAPKNKPTPSGPERPAIIGDRLRLADSGVARPLDDARIGSERSFLPMSTHRLGQTFDIAGERGTHLRIQRKLEVSRPDDIYEEQADRVAERIVGSSKTSSPATARPKEMSRKSIDDASEVDDEGALPPVPGLTRGGVVQRSCAGCDDAAPCPDCASETEDRTEAVQRKSEEAARTSSWVSESLLDDVGSGFALDPMTKDFMESRFGRDFGQVRVHADLKAAESAKAVDALAYTVGRDVVFGAGQYDVTSSKGKRLLAHELAHVVQQGAGIGAAGRPRVISQPGAPLEHGATPDAEPGSQSTRALATAPTLIQRQGNGGGGTLGGGAEPPAADECGAPIGMVKNTKEHFKGGKKMEDYYGHAANGEWAHGDTAGPFVTNQFAGSNVQLIGTVRSPCDPSKFHLTQTVTVTKDRRNGIKYSGSQEGQSGPDAPVPFRQVWLGNPDGLNITSADGPAVDYKTNVGSGLELDRKFTTSLVGPAGEKSVDWSTSIVVKDGKVTTNKVS